MTTYEQLQFGSSEGQVKSRAGAELEYFVRTATHGIEGKNLLDEAVVQVPINALRATAYGVLGLGNAVVGTVTGQKAKVVTNHGLDNTTKAVEGGIKRVGEGTLGGVVGGVYQIGADGFDGLGRDVTGAPYAIETV
jgi:hypothetical protein